MIAAAFLALMLSAEPAAQVGRGVGAQIDSREQQIRPGSASRGHDGDIFGYQLMTERERSEYRERMRAAANDEELGRIRREHRARMQARARERGVTLSGSKAGGGSIQWNGPPMSEGQ